MDIELDPAIWAKTSEASEALNRRTAPAMVAGRLRVEILSGILLPGSRLFQTKLAERMRTSTTPVREALAELAAEGLVDIDPHRGVIVHEPTEGELHEVYEMRSLLDPVLIEKTIANITDSEIQRAAALCSRMEDEAEVGTWVVLNSQFHTLMDDAARSPLLAGTVRNLRNRSSIYISASLRESPERMAEANAEHLEMVEACRRRETEAGAEPTLNHIEATVGLVTVHLQRLTEQTA